MRIPYKKCSGEISMLWRFDLIRLWNTDLSDGKDNKHCAIRSNMI